MSSRANPNKTMRVHSTDVNFNKENRDTRNNTGSVPPTKKLDMKKDLFGDAKNGGVGLKKPKNKLEGMQCNLMAQNASSIFDYIYTKYYE